MSNDGWELSAVERKRLNALLEATYREVRRARHALIRGEPGAADRYVLAKVAEDLAVGQAERFLSTTPGPVEPRWVN